MDAEHDIFAVLHEMLDAPEATLKVLGRILPATQFERVHSISQILEYGMNKP